MRSRTLKSKLLTPLAKRLSDFACGKGFVYVVPVCHILRGICFRGSRDPNGFHVASFIVPLYVPSEHISGNYGCCEIESPSPDGWWTIENSNVIDDVVQVAMEAKRRELSGVDGPREFLQRLLSGNNCDRHDPYVMEAIGYSHIMLGDYPSARRELNELIDDLESDDVPWRGPLVDRARLLIESIDHEPANAVTRLGEYERFTREQLGIPLE